MDGSIVNDNGKVFDSIEVRETFIFPNTGGTITIKQTAGMCDDEDSVVTIPTWEVENVIKALRRAKYDLKG